ncbi:MAG: M16 family metallopeptidase [Terriglobia bacterium]
MKALLTALIFGIGLAAAAAQQSPRLPKSLPPYGPVVPFHPPKVITRKLPNGLTLWLAPRPGYPKVSLAVAVRGGMSADPKELPGLSYLLLDTIDQGTKSHSAQQIADAFQAAGGDLYGTPLADSDVLTVSVLASKIRPALSILSDVLQNAEFPDSQVALAKRNEQDALSAREAEPSFLASRALAKALFGNHPYSVITQTHASIAQATAAELREQYAREFRPNAAVLVAVGDFDPVRFTDSAQELLGGWHSTAAVLPAIAPPANKDDHAVFLISRPGSVQTFFLLGSHSPTERDPDFEAAEVANTIYGGMYGSLLFKQIREAKGYSYSPHSLLSLRRQAGVLETELSVRNQVSGASLADVLHLLNRMASTAPSAQQLLRAKRFLAGTQALRYQHQSAVARKFASLWVNGLPPDEIERESRSLQQITVGQVEAAGDRYFPARRQMIVAVGDEAIIRQQLAPLGIPIKVVP